MNTKFTKEQLAAWIEDIKEAAKDDNCFSIAWFKETEDEPFTIVAGWHFMQNMPEEFCKSKSQPNYVMCIKVAENSDVITYFDFEDATMPLDKNGDVDNTCIPLEWEDSAEYAAEFFTHEWERIMEEHGEKI